MTITEWKNRKPVVPRKALRIKPNTEKKINNGSLELKLWTGEYTGALEFWLSPESADEAAMVLAKLREALPDANPDFEISVDGRESAVLHGSLHFSYRKVNYRDQ